MTARPVIGICTDLEDGRGPRAVKEKALEPALQALEKGTISADAAWKQFLNDVPIQGSY